VFWGVLGCLGVFGGVVERCGDVGMCVGVCRGVSGSRGVLGVCWGCVWVFFVHLPLGGYCRVFGGLSVFGVFGAPQWPNMPAFANNRLRCIGTCLLGVLEQVLQSCVEYNSRNMQHTAILPGAGYCMVFGGLSVLGMAGLLEGPRPRPRTHPVRLGRDPAPPPGEPSRPSSGLTLQVKANGSGGPPPTFQGPSKGGWHSRAPGYGRAFGGPSASPAHSPGEARARPSTHPPGSPPDPHHVCLMCSNRLYRQLEKYAKYSHLSRVL
jgi:hypothetical protein